MGEKLKLRAPYVGSLSVVDIFCGSGGLTLGVAEAARAAGIDPVVGLAVDVDRDALSVYERNLNPVESLPADVASLIDFRVVGWGSDARLQDFPRILHPALKSIVGNVDLLVAGPPCQGHSNLNNHTRRADPRNLLYIYAAVIGIAVGAKGIIIENVPGALSDRLRSAETASAILRSYGYAIDWCVLASDKLGWPQTRKRFFLVGCLLGEPHLREVAQSLERAPETLKWAIEDLLDADPSFPFDCPPSLSAENRRRIDYLFDHGLYDLPNHMRPECHRSHHTYPAMYGRLRWDAPSGTITTGFMSPGRGRFVHPLRRRVLTLHEAARLQGFPDWFQFSSDGKTVKKSVAARLIGNAVPAILGYAAALSVVPYFIHMSKVNSVP
jgi:DNA (cytosine-5)-methyltransferase 1